MDAIYRMRYDQEQLCSQCEKPLNECECPYVFADRPAQKSSSGVLTSGPAKRGIACRRCGCRTAREPGKASVVNQGPGGCIFPNCPCHAEP
jgi:hypothetical protein